MHSGNLACCSVMRTESVRSMPHVVASSFTFFPTTRFADKGHWWLYFVADGDPSSRSKGKGARMLQQPKALDHIPVVHHTGRWTLQLFCVPGSSLGADSGVWQRYVQVFGFMYALAAIVAAVNNNGSGEADSKSLGFVGIWAMFLVIGLSVGGTMVMRKYQTPLAVGFLIGVVLMMSLQMFSLSILFAGAAYLARQERDKGNDSTSVHSNDAGSVFSFFMFVLYVSVTAHSPLVSCLSMSLLISAVHRPDVCVCVIAGIRYRVDQEPQRDHQGRRELGAWCYRHRVGEERSCCPTPGIFPKGDLHRP